MNLFSRFLLTGLLLVALAACTPADEQYCRSFGVGGTQEYGKCISYYHQQENAFFSDRNQCDLDADQTYPRSLYDTGSYQPVMVNSYFGPRTDYAFVEPDMRRNAEVDNLRLRIVGPCMDARGWNSPISWQEGQHPVTLRKKPVPTPASVRSTPTAAPLPWLITP